VHGRDWLETGEVFVTHVTLWEVSGIWHPWLVRGFKQVLHTYVIFEENLVTCTYPAQFNKSLVLKSFLRNKYPVYQKLRNFNNLILGIKNVWYHALINPLKPELNPICYLLALLVHHFLHVSRIRVKSLTFRRLMSYIYGAPILDVSRSHTTTQHSR